MKTLPFLISLFFLSACGGGSAKEETIPTSQTRSSESKYKSPENYGEHITEVHEEINSDISEFTQNIAQDSPEELETQLKVIKGKIKESKEELAVMDDYEGNKELLNQATEVLDFYDSTLTNDYSKIITILKKGDDLSPEDAKELKDIATRVATQGVTKIKDYEIAKNEFQQQFNIEPVENDPNAGDVPEAPIERPKMP